MMRPVGSISSLLAALTTLAALVACAPVQVSTFTRAEMETARYATYEWVEPGSRSVGDPRLDGDSVFAGYVTAAVDEQLRVRGLEPASTGMGDLRVQWSASTAQRAYRGDRQSEAGCGDCAIDLFDEGTLVIDLVDARTNRLVWRGWATAAIDGVVADQARLERRVHDAVERILDRLPRGVGRAAPLL